MSARSPAAKSNRTTVQTSLGTKKHVGNALTVPDQTQFAVCLATASRNLLRRQYPPTPPPGSQDGVMPKVSGKKGKASVSQGLKS